MVRSTGYAICRAGRENAGKDVVVTLLYCVEYQLEMGVLEGTGDCRRIVMPGSVRKTLNQAKLLAIDQKQKHGLIWDVVPVMLCSESERPGLSVMDTIPIRNQHVSRKRGHQ